MRRSHGGIALLTCIALLAAACGARVAPYLGAGAGATGSPGGPAQVSPGQTVAPGASPNGAAPSPGTATGSVSNGASTGPSPAGGPAGAQPSSGAATPAGQTPPSAAALTPQNFPFNPAQEAALCSGNTGNTASDQGVATDSITLGNVSGLTGILSNSFNQGQEAVQALFSSVNAAGGICGRQLKLQTEDDGQDSTKNASDVADLDHRVFAFVGSTSDADNGGVNEMQQAGTPDFGFSINANRAMSPNYWSAGGGSQYEQNGHIVQWNNLPLGLKQYGHYPLKFAVLSYSIPISAQAGQRFATLFQKSGSSICFTDYSISPVTAGLDSDVLQMKNRGCDGVFTTMDVTGNAKLYDAMQRQDFHPAHNSTTFDGYTPAQISTAGVSAVQGVEIDAISFVPFNEPNPVMQEYLKELATYEPGKQPSGFGWWAWAAAQMFIYGLIKAGRNPTRASVTNVMNGLTNWNSGGAAGPVTPSQHGLASNCIIQLVIKGNDFVRKWPASGFFCAGQLTVTG